MNTSKAAKKRIKYQGDNKKKTKLSLIIIGSALLLGGVACAITLPLTLHKKPAPYEPKATYVIEDGSDDPYFMVANHELQGFKDGQDGVFKTLAYDTLLIPNTIVSIDDHAFDESFGKDGNIKNIELAPSTINNTFANIGEYAFDFCDGLQTITFPKNITTISKIGSGAFDHCENLSFHLSGQTLDISSIGDYAFNWCTKLTYDFVNKISLPAGYTKHITSQNNGGIAWQKDGEDNLHTAGCLAVGEIDNVAGGITWFTNVSQSIGSVAFRGCASITSVVGINCPIGTQAFYGCLSLSNTLVLGSSTNQIGNYAFEYCGSLTAVQFLGILSNPSGTSIGMQAFYDCPNIQSYTYNETQTLTNFSIGSIAFEYCSETGTISGPSISQQILNLMQAEANGGMTGWSVTA